MGSREAIGIDRQELYRRGKIGGSMQTLVTIMAASLVPAEDGWGFPRLLSVKVR